MHRHTPPIAFYAALLLSVGAKPAPAAPNDAILRIEAPELSRLDFNLSTGGLPVAPGLEIHTVMRADREHPEKADGLGWTYHHHQDIAAWQGRLYVAWDSCERDEGVWPARELYSTSTNGRDWSRPAELFPQGVSTQLRTYFFHAPNGRMLVIAGYRGGHPLVPESHTGALVVREVYADHTLGPVFTLRPPTDVHRDQPPGFATSRDEGFVTACRQLLADHLFLLQNDYGWLLDPKDRLIWNDPANWGEEAVRNPEVSYFGKALCFFERKDGALVAVGKVRWVTLSRDGGKTWSHPEQPPSFISGGGKVWVQRIPDGRWVIIYNPHKINRWPLVMLDSDDGITFRHPMALHGELPPRRYDGLNKDPGQCYHRGLGKWNSDGSWPSDAIWLVCSLNKEEIRVLRIPFPPRP